MARLCCCIVCLFAAVAPLGVFAKVAGSDSGSAMPCMGCLCRWGCIVYTVCTPHRGQRNTVLRLYCRNQPSHAPSSPHCLCLGVHMHPCSSKRLVGWLHRHLLVPQVFAWYTIFGQGWAVPLALAAISSSKHKSVCCCSWEHVVPAFIPAMPCYCAMARRGTPRGVHSMKSARTGVMVV